MRIPFDPETDLRIERHMKARAETIWRCWEEPSLFKQWFTPPTVEVAKVENILQPGGRAFVEMKLPDGALVPNEGCFLHVDRPHLLVYSDALTTGYRPATEPFMTAIVETIEGADGTLYRATVLHADRNARRKHEEFGFHDGWGTTLDQLSRLVQTL